MVPDTDVQRSTQKPRLSIEYAASITEYLIGRCMAASVETHLNTAAFGFSIVILGFYNLAFSESVVTNSSCEIRVVSLSFLIMYIFKFYDSSILSLDSNQYSV